MPTSISALILQKPKFWRGNLSARGSRQCMLTLFIAEHIPAPHIGLPCDQRRRADRIRSITKNLYFPHEPFSITFPSSVFTSLTTVALFSPDQTRPCAVTAPYFKFITTKMHSSICHPTWFYEDCKRKRLHNIARTYTNRGGAHSEHATQTCCFCSHPSLTAMG